jgi:hypothetical protein
MTERGERGVGIGVRVEGRRERKGEADAGLRVWALYKA